MSPTLPLRSTEPASLITRWVPLIAALEALLLWAAPLGELLLRLWVANAFWVSGLTKIESWETTLQLFEYEYSVPLLPPVLAAYAGTAAELVLPVFLVLGLCGRWAAAALFVFNIIAVISYPALEAAGLEQHKVWGLMLLYLVLRGPGWLSVDGWFGRLRSPGA
jgi:putative oxidoreductase